MSLDVRPLHPLFAAEIRRIQVAEPIESDAFAEVRAALDTYSVLVFRDQRLSDEAHIAFSRRFGELETTVKGNVAAGSKFARQSNVDVATGAVIPPGDPRLTYLKAARFWHTDSSYKRIPSLCSLLAAYVVPPEGGDTQFATARAAYDALDPARRDALLGMAADHSQMHSLGLVDAGVITPQMRAEATVARHPLVRRNPANGRRNIYLGTHAFRIADLSLDDGSTLIRELNEFVTQPQFVYAHAWRAGDLVVWDNRCVLHRATSYDAVRYKRLLQRTTVAGNEAEYLEDAPAAKAVARTRRNRNLTDGRTTA